MKIFFIGICGVSMSALACMARDRGDEVVGSDKNYLNPPACLKDIMVFPQPFFKGIEWADLVVYSSAIHDDTEELQYANLLGRKNVVRGQFLGDVARDYEKVIAIAGSHGKTTTTAMIFHVLSMAGKRPSLHLGGLLKDINSNVVLGGKEFLVTEACEYHDNFLFLHPYLAGVTNIEPEHLDYFHTFKNEKKSYSKFLKNCEKVAIFDDLKAKNIVIDEDGRLHFSIFENGKRTFRLNTKIGGKYNTKNACLCVAICRELGISDCVIERGLNSFPGVKKRCERIDSKYPFKLFVDYAHHPREIKESAKYFCDICKGRCVAVFQPHTYSRTKAFYNDFLTSLSLFDEVICYKTYPAREVEAEGLTETDLAIGLRDKNKDVKVCLCVEDLDSFLKKYTREDLVVFLGAGDLPDKFNFN